jgi:enamine deaminase RidA (YjgF/YER057c/UK114 family)
LAAAGASLADAVKTQNLLVDLADWKDVNQVWSDFMVPVPPPRSSISLQNLIVPGARVVTSVIALVPSADNRREEVTEGVPFRVSKHGYNFSPAVRTRDWISLAGQMAYDYSTFTRLGANPRLPHLGSEIEVQTEAIMVDRMEILAANQGGTAEVLEAKVFLTDPRRDYRGFARAWQRWFPDPDSAPALQIIPITGVHYEGTVIEIELLAAAQG